MPFTRTPLAGNTALHNIKYTQSGLALIGSSVIQSAIEE